MLRAVNRTCPGCKKLLMQSEPPCLLCGWNGRLADAASMILKLHKTGIKFMVIVAIINFGLAMWMGTWVFHGAFWHPYELFYTLWFMIGNGGIFAYAMYKFVFVPWRKDGQKKSV